MRAHMYLRRADAEVLVIDVTCPHCEATAAYYLSTEKFQRWRGGELIQNVWPEMSDNDREGLITGICGDCWEEMFFRHTGDTEL